MLSVFNLAVQMNFWSAILYFRGLWTRHWLSLGRRHAAPDAAARVRAGAAVSGRHDLVPAAVPARRAASLHAQVGRGDAGDGAK